MEADLKIWKRIVAVGSEVVDEKNAALVAVFEDHLVMAEFLLCEAQLSIYQLIVFLHVVTASD